MPKFVTLFALSSLLVATSAWGANPVKPEENAPTCAALLSGKDLFLKAIGEKNDAAALFLMTHLTQLHADKQADAQLINEAIAAGASKAVVAALLSDRRNLKLVDLRGRTPLRASLAAANTEAQEVLSEMGQNPGMFDQLQTSFSDLRKVLAGLKDLGLTKQERRTFVEAKWESFYNGKFSDRLTFTEVLAMALKARNLDVLNFAQASGKKYVAPYADIFGDIALEMIKAGGAENLPYLRFLHTYARTDFFKIGFMEHHNDNHSFNRGSVFDLVYEYAVRGKVLRENTSVERMPDYAMLKFLYEEVGYKPSLWTSNNYRHLATSADSRLLDYLVNGPYPARDEFMQITKEGVEASDGSRSVFDIWRASMPTESYLEGRHKGSWSYDELPLPNGIDPSAVDKEKIDILLKAGYDPSKSVWLNTAAADIASGKEQSYEYGGRDKARVESILKELRKRGYKFAK
jgi:hypothetical protein